MRPQPGQLLRQGRWRSVLLPVAVLMPRVGSGRERWVRTGQARAVAVQAGSGRAGVRWKGAHPLEPGADCSDQSCHEFWQSQHSCGASGRAWRASRAQLSKGSSVLRELLCSAAGRTDGKCRPGLAGVAWPCLLMHRAGHHPQMEPQEAESTFSSDSEPSAHEHGARASLNVHHHMSSEPFWKKSSERSSLSQ